MFVRSCMCCVRTSWRYKHLRVIELWYVRGSALAALTRRYVEGIDDGGGNGKYCVLFSSTTRCLTLRVFLCSASTWAKQRAADNMAGIPWLQGANSKRLHKTAHVNVSLKTSRGTRHECATFWPSQSPCTPRNNNREPNLFYPRERCAGSAGLLE